MTTESPLQEYNRLNAELAARPDYWRIDRFSDAVEERIERRMDVLWIAMTKTDRIAARDFGHTLAHSVIGG